MQSAIAVANFFIVTANEEGVTDVNVSKLQDLVFCAHGWCLGITNKPLLETEIIANRDGPEIPEVVEAASGYGTKRVSDPIRQVAATSENTARIHLDAPMVPDGDPDEKILKLTWKAYGKLSTFDLSRVTQAVEGPWDQVWNDPARTSGVPVRIPGDLIREWFRDFAERNRKRTEAPTREDTQRIEIGRLRQM